MSLKDGNKKYGLLILIIIGLPASWVTQRNRHSFDLEQPGVPIKIVSESASSGAGALRQAKIFLPKEYYSKKNLDAIFLWYSRKHSSTEDESLQAFVFTEMEKIRIDPESLTDRLVPYDASFYRRGNGSASGGGSNEWYIFSPDLSKPNKTKTVVLRGHDPHSERVIIETSEISGPAFKVRITKYELGGDVEPKGMYYAFESVLAESDSADMVFIIQQNQPVDIPRQQVQFINAQVGYVFMGWIYAVTADGGKTWQKWDAERELPNWQCCDTGLIQKVDVGLDGIGSMTLKPNPQRPEEVLTLRTTDYGQHWAK